MLLTVKALQGRECSVEVSPHERVGALKLLVAERLQVPVEQQRLLYRGRALSDDRLLSDYSIGPSSRINLVLKPPPGDAPPPPCPSPSPCPSPPGFGGALGRVLGRHLGEQEVQALMGQLCRDYALGLRALSLDDVERLGTRVLLGSSAPSAAGHAPPAAEPGPAPCGAGHAP